MIKLIIGICIGLWLGVEFNDEIMYLIETFQNTTRTKQASGGLAKMLGE